MKTYIRYIRSDVDNQKPPLILYDNKTSWTGRASNGQKVDLRGISEAEVRYGGRKSAADQLVIPGYLGLTKNVKHQKGLQVIKGRL